MTVSDPGTATLSGPLVSVIIPTFNRADHIADAVRSVTAQTHQHLDIIVVDDGSDDDTKAQVKPLLEDGRVRYIYQANAGSAVARNTGLDAARGDYIAFLDSDDLWLPESVALRLRAFDLLPADVPALFTDHEREFDGGRVTDETYFTKGGFMAWLEPYAPHATLEGASLYVLPGPFLEFQATTCVMNTDTVIFKRACLDDGLRFDPFYRRCQDWDLFTRLARDYRVACLCTPTARMRYWIEGVTNDGVTQREYEYRLLSQHRGYFKEKASRRALRRKMGECQWFLAFGLYQRGARLRSLRSCFAAMMQGGYNSRLPAIVVMNLLPRSVQDMMKKVNPWRGTPIS